MRPPPIETWPEWANYAAEELSGSWYLYLNKPRWNEVFGEWEANGRREIVPRITIQAKDSLIAHPRAVQCEADTVNAVRSWLNI